MFKKLGIEIRSKLQRQYKEGEVNIIDQWVRNDMSSK